MKNPSTVHSGYSRAFYERVLMNPNQPPLNWMGVPVVKHPNDLLAYQEILYLTRPDLIIETGVFLGGSTLFLAHVCDVLGHGRVLGVDLQTDKPLPEHPRVDYLLGMSSTDKVTVSHVAKHAAGKRCMVILDSAHNRRHVLAELRLYGVFVSKGCYLIVEDTNEHGYQYAPGDITGDGGPAEAIRDWQPRNRGFERDETPERFLMTFNPHGYLRRVR